MKAERSEGCAFVRTERVLPGSAELEAGQDEGSVEGDAEEGGPSPILVVSYSRG